MDSVRSAVLGCLVASLAALSGCYTVEFHETDHPVGVTPLETGPGGAEGELFACVDLARYSYSGEKISIGLFPGYSFFREGLGMGPYEGTLVYALWVPVGNLFLAVPTLCTILVEPFFQGNPKRKTQNGDIMALGIVGAFRWRSPAHVEVEEGERENAVIDAKCRVDPKTIPHRRESDGTAVYFAYPGFRALKQTVDREGRVDVLFADGTAVRRFTQSKRDADRLTYGDRAMTDDLRTYWERERALARKLERRDDRPRKER